MYSTVITLKSEIPDDVLHSLRNVIERAFDNRAGQVDNRSNNPLEYIFYGDESLRTCLHLGNFTLKDTNDIRNYIGSWQWIDTDDPDESCNIFDVIAAVESR
jgi:hypothetical protein